MNIDQPTATLVAALVAATASAFVAVWGFFSRKRLDRSQALVLNELNTELESTKGEIQSGLESVRHELTRVRDFDQFASQRIADRVNSLIASSVSIAGSTSLLDRQEAFRDRLADVEVEFARSCASIELDLAWLHSASVVDDGQYARCDALLEALSTNWREAMQQVVIDQKPERYGHGAFDVDRFYEARSGLEGNVRDLRSELITSIVPEALRSFVQSRSSS